MAAAWRRIKLSSLNQLTHALLRFAKGDLVEAVRTWQQSVKGRSAMLEAEALTDQINGDCASVVDCAIAVRII